MTVFKYILYHDKFIVGIALIVTQLKSCFLCEINSHSWYPSVRIHSGSQNWEIKITSAINTNLFTQFSLQKLICRSYLSTYLCFVKLMSLLTLASWWLIYLGNLFLWHWKRILIRDCSLVTNLFSPVKVVTGHSVFSF